VYTLLDVFDATRDLYQTLTNKDKRELELHLRAKGYSGSSRQLDYVDDAGASGKRGILTDKLAVLKRFEDGLRDVGDGFAVGDGESLLYEYEYVLGGFADLLGTALSHVSLQSEVIRLQGVLLATFLYGPTSEEPLQQQLAKIDAASNATATAAVDAFDAFQLRLQAELRSSIFPGSRRGSLRAGSPSMPGSFVADDERSTAMVTYREPSRVRSGSPVNTTILTKGRGSASSLRDTRSLTSHNPPPSQSFDGLYCPYAIDLERHRSQSLSPSITSAPTPCCPDCKRTLHLSPGKAWEILKSDTGYPRCFQISTRFVVKCHRPGPDAGYACILCSRAAGIDEVAVCGDVKALVKHMCEEHGSRELKAEEDITEVVELGRSGSLRDGGSGGRLGSSSSRGSRRSASVSSRRKSRGSAGWEREVEAVEIRPRRGL